MLFVLRLTVTPGSQGYRTTLCVLREECAAAGVDLPQEEPPAASTAWKGHRVLATDGPELTLPREPADRGFRVADGAHHPQDMVSVLHRLRDRTPVDLHLFDHGNGRQAALTHLDHAAEGDVIVHDSGYHPFAMALAHPERGPHLLFRIKRRANPTFDGFIASDRTDRTMTLDAPRDETALRGRTLRVRPVRYTAGDTGYRLATSLPDSDGHGIQPPSTSITDDGAPGRCTEAENG